MNYLDKVEPLWKRTVTTYLVDAFPTVDKKSWFYKNCKRQRKVGAKICQVCPFRSGIEKQEKTK